MFFFLNSGDDNGISAGPLRINWKRWIFHENLLVPEEMPPPYEYIEDELGVFDIFIYADFPKQCEFQSTISTPHMNN